MGTKLNAEQVGFHKTQTDGGLGNYTTLQNFVEQKTCKDLAITETKQVTVSNADFVLIDSTMISGKLAIGTATTSVDGGIACAKLGGAVGTAATTTITDTEGRIWNDVEIVSSGTHDTILTNGGQKIFGLMHCDSSANDGDAIGATGSESAQLSFVYYDTAGILQNVTINETIQFNGAIVQSKLNEPIIVRQGGVSRVDITPSGDANFTQGFTNATSTLVNHNLGKKPGVTLTDSGGNQFFATIVHNSDNQLVATWDTGLLSGSVSCN